jgi:L-malate glycosyltransferase
MEQRRRSVSENASDGKILLITNWYPHREGDTTNPRAIADFVECWRRGSGIETLALVPDKGAERVKISSYNGQRIILIPEFPNIRSKFRRRKSDHIQKFLKRMIKYVITLRLFRDVIRRNSVLRRIRRAFPSGFEPEIVLIHGYLMHGAYLSRYLRFKVPVVACFHKTDYIKIDKTIEGIRYCKKFLAGIAVRSPLLARKFSSLRFPSRCGPLFVAGSGVSEAFLIPRDEYRLLPESGPVKVLSVGTLNKNKSFDKVLFALSQLKGRDWEYHVFGEGAERAALERLAGELGISDRVRFLGFCMHDELMDRMRGYDIFVLTSASETFGLVFLEALAKGLFIVGTKGEGIDGVVIDGLNGFLVKHADIDALSITLQGILDMERVAQASFKDQIYRLISQMTQEKAAMDYLGFLRKVSCPR